MAFPNYPSGQSGAGTLFQLPNTLSPETFSTVARIGNIKGPSSTYDRAVTTSGAAVPAGGGPVFKTFIPTVIDPGTISFDLFIKTDNANDRLLLAHFRNGDILDFNIVEADSLLSVTRGTGFFQKFDMDHPINGAVKAACTFQLTGPLYWFE